MELHNNELNVKPFLRWAGGKSWFIRYINQILNGCEFVNYHEPFLGGGAVFLSIDIPSRAYLSDLNEELIITYKVIKEKPNDLIYILRQFTNSMECYYRIREEEYHDDIHKAAKFVFLNQTSFNGLYRVNLQGKYNVPYGFRSKNFLDEESIHKASQKLQCASLRYCDFMAVQNNIQKRDLVFLDPPYTVAHNKNGFIKYNQKLFSIEDQMRLSQLIDHIKSIGAFYVLTNAAHETIAQIFRKDDRLLELNRASLLGGKNAKRGSTTEFVFTNISE